MEELLKNLNEKQREAVLQTEGPDLVLAPLRSSSYEGLRIRGALCY